jgi:hypothetical protein
LPPQKGVSHDVARLILIAHRRLSTAATAPRSGEARTCLRLSYIDLKQADEGYD